MSREEGAVHPDVGRRAEEVTQPGLARVPTTFTHLNGGADG